MRGGHKGDDLDMEENGKMECFLPICAQCNQPFTYNNYYPKKKGI